MFIYKACYPCSHFETFPTLSLKCWGHHTWDNMIIIYYIEI